MIDEDHPLRKKGETLFFFPFYDKESARKDILRRLNDMEYPILFLSHLQEVKWVDSRVPQKIHYFSKEVEQLATSDSILCSRVKTNSNDFTRELLLFSQTITISGQGQHRINVAYYMDGDGRIDTAIRPKIHCFFPTSQNFDLCTIVHAPFELVESRQQLKESSKVNRLLIDCLATLFVSSLLLMRDLSKGKKKKLLNDNIFQIIPLEPSEYHYGYYDNEEIDITSCTPFYNAVYKAVQKEGLLPTKGGGFAKSSDVAFCAPHSLSVTIVDDTVLKHFDKKYLISAGVSEMILRNNDIRVFLRNCGVREIDTNNVLSVISPEFMNTRSMAWTEAFYKFMMNEATTLWQIRPYASYPLRKTAFIKTTKGNFVSPNNENGDINVFFPIGKTSTNGNYNIVADELIQSNICKEFLEKLGVKSPSILDHIKSVTLPKYNESRKFTYEEINEDIIELYSYYRSLTLQEQNEFVALCKDKIRLVDTEKYLYLPSKLYVLNENQKHISSINNQAHFLDIEFYKDALDTYGKTDILTFFILLGVSDRLKIIQHIQTGSNLYSFPDYVRDILPFFSSSRNITITDYCIPGLDNYLFFNCNEEDNKYLWNCLAQFPQSLISVKRMEARYFYRSTKYCSGQASVAYLLKTKKWILNKLPHEVTQEEMAEAGYTFCQPLFDYFGIKSKAQNLADLGASEEQIENESMGDFCRRNNISMDDLKGLVEEKSRKDIIISGSLSSEDFGNSRQELKDMDTSKMFSDVEEDWKEYRKSNKKQNNEARIESIQEKTQEKLDELNRIAHIEEAADKAEKYSAGWFKNLLELEYRGSLEEQRYDRKGLQISFSKVRKDPSSDRILVLSDPSHIIPMWVEEIGGLEVKFDFLNSESLYITFEVANVRDFVLRLKVKGIDVSTINSLDWTHCTRALIIAQKPVELVGKLKTAFSNLGFNDDDNLKELLAPFADRISFVFGPPGTGKTTRLSNIINTIITNFDECKILVLAPTNKACDVLASKILSINPESTTWLGRFVNVGDDRLEDYNIKIERDSEFYSLPKCCLISTIARLPFDGFTSSDDGSTHPIKELDWNFVVIDEASMIPLADVVFALYNFRNTMFFIAGDPFQIDPIVREKRWQHENIYSMVNLNDFKSPTTEPVQFNVMNLETQYRSVPAIGEVFSEFSYKGSLKHNRNKNDLKKITIPGFDIKPLNIITFPVYRFDNIFKPNKLDGSPIHIYSAILTSEICRYFAYNIQAEPSTEIITVGIICPYSAQAQLVQKLIEQNENITGNVKFVVGTVHSFQGDQCEIIFAIMNPPSITSSNVNNVFLNRKEIINVAVSRASDYLFLLMPHPDYEGFDNLKELNRLGKIMSHRRGNINSMTCDQVEEVIFGKKFFIENSTFMTSHQLANVYSKASYLYEVRLDDSSIDIQLGNKESSDTAQPKPVLKNSEYTKEKIDAQKVSFSHMLDAMTIAKRGNTPSPRKHIMLLAILHCIKYGFITKNRIMLNEDLVSTHNRIWHEMFKSSIAFPCNPAKSYLALLEEPFFVAKYRNDIDNRDCNIESIKAAITSCRIGDALFKFMCCNEGNDYLTSRLSSWITESIKL